MCAVRDHRIFTSSSCLHLQVLNVPYLTAVLGLLVYPSAGRNDQYTVRKDTTRVVRLSYTQTVLGRL